VPLFWAFSHKYVLCNGLFIGTLNGLSPENIFQDADFTLPGECRGSALPVDLLA
jgi:hypothetical protein